MIWLLAAGAVMGAVFDMYNTTLGSSGWLRWLRPLADLLFWATAALAVFRIAYVADDGRVRLYLFVLVALGWGLYAFTLRNWVVSSAQALVRAVAAVLQAFWFLVHLFLVRPLWALCQFAVWLAKSGYRLLCLLENATWGLLRTGLRISGLRWLGRQLGKVVFTQKAVQTWEEIWGLASNWLLTAWHRTRSSE
ncbi:MAG: spore cortex biosynthesis protein YabQ [Alicyclobacillus sp.]|nr:spore cortex biosynthesis protein YabQ [Alicyclobacillus sp.]